MSRPARWNELRSEPLQDCRVFQVGRSFVESPKDGETHTFFRIDSADWVNVIPITDAGEIVMVRQYRHGKRDLTLELPGGMVDPGEEPAVAAAREVLEETGYAGGEVVSLGSVNPNPALFGNRLHAFVLPGVKRVAEIQNDVREETVVELVPRERIPELVLGEQLDHALCLAALYFYELSRG